MKKSKIYLLAIMLLGILVACGNGASGNNNEGSSTVPSTKKEQQLIKQISYYPDGTVKSERTYDEKGDYIECSYYENGKLKEESFHTNSYGWHISRTIKQCDSDGNVLSETVTEYDNFGNVKKSITYGENGRVTHTNEIEYEYDEKGNVIKEQPYVNGIEGQPTYYSYEYDENGNISQSTATGVTNQIKEYNADGTLRKSTHYYDSALSYVSSTMDFDENGTILSIIGYYADGSISDEKTYDEKGNLLKEIRYYEDGSIQGEDIYDEHGTWVKSVDYDMEGNPNPATFRNIEFEYDSNGNVITATNYDVNNNKSVSKYEYEYDSNGNISVRTICDENNNKSVSKYEYNQYGNTSKVTYEKDGKVTSWTEYIYADEVE